MSICEHRVAVMRSFVMNHMVHHRAQPGVTSGLNDAGCRRFG